VVFVGLLALFLQLFVLGVAVLAAAVPALL
jgi:hypothetical protein